MLTYQRELPVKPSRIPASFPKALSQWPYPVAAQPLYSWRLHARPRNPPTDRLEGPSHTPLDAFDELVRITRPGGRLVFSVARGYLDGSLEDKGASLESKGAWRRIDRTHVYNSTPVGDELLARVYVYEAC